MSNPLITIITSTLNEDYNIKNLSNSLLIQTYQNFEWLIVDGGSTDRTLDVIKDINKANLICTESDNGIYDAWNKGLDKAKGEWIIFLGADDILYNKNVLKSFSNFTKNIPNFTDIIYGKVLSNKKACGKKIYNLKRKIVNHMCICHQATFHRNSIFKSIGFFNSNYKITGDYEFLLRAIVRNNKRAFFFNELISIMGSNGISSNKKNGYFTAIEMYKSRLENNIFPITIRWLRHFIAALYYKIFFYFKQIIN